MNACDALDFFFKVFDALCEAAVDFLDFAVGIDDGIARDVHDVYDAVRHVVGNRHDGIGSRLVLIKTAKQEGVIILLTVAVVFVICQGWRTKILKSRAMIAIAARVMPPARIS